MAQHLITADLEGTPREPNQLFPDFLAAEVYACRHGLRVTCAGTQEFEKRQRMLPPGAFELYTYRSKKRVKTCGMFSLQFLHIDFLVERGIVEIDNGMVRVLDEDSFARCGGLTNYPRKQMLITSG
jgi:hypothetical protein